MVNPYLELNRAMTQRRIKADKMLQPGYSERAGSVLGSAVMGMLGEGEDTSTQSGNGQAQGPFLLDSNSNPVKELEHNAISFGKWFFFCQHCRHGGHANCIDQWFGGSGNVVSDGSACKPCSTGNASMPIKRTVCGVNGCDCKCVSRL